MYLYLYDSFLVDQKYRRLIDRIETRLTDLGINGKTVRLTILKNAGEVIKDNLRSGIDAVVVIGGDGLFSESAMALAGTGVTLGFIPVGNSRLAEILDIPPNEAACDTISGRRIENVDLGRVNGQYFLNSLKIDSKQATLRCDDLYHIEQQSTAGFKVINLDWINFSLADSQIQIEKKTSNARDGWLEVVFDQKPKSKFIFFKHPAQKDSLFYLRKLYVPAVPDKEIRVLVDGTRVLKLPIVVEVIPKCLKIIVGRNRLI